MKLIKNILDKILGTNTLYYPGCFTKKLLPDVQERYEKILDQLGIEYIKLADKEFCCGSPVVRAGEKKAFENIKQKNIEIFKSYSIGRIITNCPACYSMFQEEYNLSEQNIEVKHMTQILANSDMDTDVWKNQQRVYHDPCHLGRLSWIYDEPRKVLTQAGYNIKEFDKNKEKSSCCGWWGWLTNNNPELANKISQNLLNELNEGETLSSPCPMCYYQFKKNAKNVNIEELSQSLLSDR